MKVFLAGTAQTFTELPTVRESLDDRSGAFSFAVNGSLPDPNDQAVLVQSGNQWLYRGLYRNLSVETSPGQAEHSQADCESWLNLTRTTVLRERISGGANDVLREMITAAGVDELLGIPESPADGQVVIEAGLFLDEALDAFCQTLGLFWGVDIVSGALVVFLPDSATLAPSTPSLTPSGCDPNEALIGSVTYTIGTIRYSTVIAAGKDALLSMAGQDLPPRPEETAETVEANSPQRIFPLLSERTRVLSVDVTPLGGGGTPLFDGPRTLAFDAAGNLYIGDGGNNRIRKVSTGGILSTFAGVGTSGHAGDGGPATDAEIWDTFHLTGLVADSDYLYLCGLDNSSPGDGAAVRRIHLGTGTVSLFAGNYTTGDSGDGGPATDAEIQYPRGIALDGAGDLYIAAGPGNYSIRKVSGGTITRPLDGDTHENGMVFDGTNLAGPVLNLSGTLRYFGTDGSGPTDIATGLVIPLGAAHDPDSGDYFCLNFDLGNSVYKIARVTSGGSVSHFAGADTVGYSGDGGPAVDAEFNFTTQAPIGLAVHDGWLYVADTGNHCVRRINLATGTVTLYAGTPQSSGFAGDGGPATP